jgi:hypothetical protein
MAEDYDGSIRWLKQKVADLERLYEQQLAAMRRRDRITPTRHDEQLAWAIGVLEPRAAQDPELAKVLELLRQWARGGENGWEARP